MSKIIGLAIILFISMHIYFYGMENYQKFDVGECVKIKSFIYTWKINYIENKTYHLQIYVDSFKIYTGNVNAPFIVANTGFLKKTACK